MGTSFDRKLAAIMFTDIAGFTRLMQENESQGLTSRKLFLETLNKQHEVFYGEVVRTMGDGSLSIFENAIDAVQCAIAMQKELHTIVPLRIGLHLGHVMRDPHDGIVGDAVNIASRIESFSVEGAVLVSDSLYDHVRNQEGLSFDPMGTFHLKNTLRTYDLYAVHAEGLVVPKAEYLKGKGDRTSLNAAPLPLPDMPLMGRAKEIEAVTQLMREGTVRLVTITGAGGMGKTRLSIATAHQLQDEFPDGVAFISLTETRDPNEVFSTINTALEIFETDAVSPFNSLTTVIGQKHVLMVLDNLEQVIHAAPEIAKILDICPEVKLLITSRIPLKINAEYEYKLGPLELPANETVGAIEDLISCPSVSLFTSRAQKVRSSFTLSEDNKEDVVSICNKMDGMPLAIELAAARIRLLSPDDLLNRLNHSLDVLTRGPRDLPERHQTLRATIDWSYSLLEPSEKELLQKLGVFAGGFTLECVETVCGRGQVLDDLESLEEKGLVQRMEEAEMRFRLLQTIREFALEKLEESGEWETIRKNHAYRFLDIAHVINLGTRGEDQLAQMRRGILEEPNLYEALNWFAREALQGNGDACEKGLEMCGELFGYWHYRGKNVLAKEWSEKFLGLPSCPEISHEKVNAMYTVFLCLWVMGHFDRALEVSEKALEMAIKLDLPYEIAMGDMAIGLCHFVMGNMAEAAKHLEAGETNARAHGNDYLTALCIMMHGMQCTVAGNLAKAKELMTESHEIFVRLDEHQGLGGTFAGLALISKFEGEYDHALELYAHALQHYILIGDKAEEARVLEETAWTWLKKNDSLNGRKYFIKCLQAFREVASLRGVGVALMGLSACEIVDKNFYKAAVITGAALAYSKKEGILNPYSDNYASMEYQEQLEQSISKSEFTSGKGEGLGLTEEDILAMI